MTRRTVRDAWREEVLCTKRIRDACRVLLLHLATGTHRNGPHTGAPLMTATGYVRGVKHADLARHLQTTEKQVGRRLQEAREQGLLVIVGGGHNGQPTMYAAQLQGPLKAPAERGPSDGPDSLRDFVKPPAHKGPSQVAERGPSAVTGNTPSVTKPPAERGAYVRARARAHYRNREQDLTPDGGRGPEPHHSPNRSSDEEPATAAPVVTDRLSVPTAQQQTGDGRAHFEAVGRALREAVLGEETAS